MEIIGKGGMGAVYRAKDQKLGREVAIKVLPEEFASDPERMARFEREAKLLASLNHANIITIFDVDKANGQGFIVMEFVDGETLRKQIARDRMDLLQVLDVAIQVTSALASAHNAKIIHRDLKPENIMVRPDGHVKVLDFGLAKLLSPSPAILNGESISTGSQLTELGVMIGTTEYMSPEQIRGEKLDYSSDIFSLASIIYEMITCQKCFGRDNTAETLAAILHEHPAPLARYVNDFPSELQRIISKAHRKDKRDRYHSTAELLLDLKQLKISLVSEQEPRQMGRFSSEDEAKSALSEIRTRVLSAMSCQELRRAFYETDALLAKTPNDPELRVLKDIIQTAIEAEPILSPGFNVGNLQRQMRGVGRINTAKPYFRLLTLAPLLIAGVIVLLAVFIVPSYIACHQKANEIKAIQGLRTIADAEIAYSASHSGRYADLKTLAVNGFLSDSFAATDSIKGYRYSGSISNQGKEFIFIASPVENSGRYAYFVDTGMVVRYLNVPPDAPPDIRSGDPVEKILKN